jgi:hypothetical protein
MTWVLEYRSTPQGRWSRVSDTEELLGKTEAFDKFFSPEQQKRARATWCEYRLAPRFVTKPENVVRVENGWHLPSQERTIRSYSPPNKKATGAVNKSAIKAAIKSLQEILEAYDG